MSTLRPGKRILGLALFVAALSAGAALSQNTNNEFEIKSAPSNLDKAEGKADIWALDFRFKAPRLIKVNYPGRGTRMFWYMWYQVINRTEQPRLIAPTFELVSHEPPGVHLDEVLPAVVEAISKVEDSTGYQEIKNSVTISEKPIPVSKAADEAFARAVTGVAVWDASPADLKKRDVGKEKDLSDSVRFSVFIRGLSNGSVQVDNPMKDGPPVTRYKTLQLNFKRQGDRFSTDSRDISFAPPAEWIYRAASRK